jgi:uncharacterized SAM-binding protein YcdF (DUF218 family)
LVFWKLLHRLADPFTVASCCLAAGCVMSWFENKRKLGRTSTTAGVALLVLLAYGVPFNPLARALEDKYHPITDLRAVRDVRWIVVLGGGHVSSPDVPVNSQVGASSLFRIIEAMRLLRAIPESRILFLGGRTFDAVSQAAISGDVALTLGVVGDQISLEEHPRTTAAEMSCVHQIVGAERFVLVTTAIHMPRAIMLASEHGLRAIPSPTDYRTRASDGDRLQQLLPQAGAFAIASATLHELIGIAWIRITAALFHLSGDREPCGS